MTITYIITYICNTQDIEVYHRNIPEKIYPLLQQCLNCPYELLNKILHLHISNKYCGKKSQMIYVYNNIHNSSACRVFHLEEMDLFVHFRKSLLIKKQSPNLHHQVN